MNWQEIYNQDGIEGNVLIEDGKPVRLSVSPADYDGDEVEEAFAKAFPEFELDTLNWDSPSGEDCVVCPVREKELTGYQKEAIKAQARVTAQMFVDEFNEVLDPATTDWDGTAWQEDVSSLPFELSSEQRDEGWPIYQAELVKETKKLCEEGD